MSGVNVKETAKRLGVHVKSMDLLAHNCAANVSGLAAFIPYVCVCTVFVRKSCLKTRSLGLNTLDTA